jgi:hypothetical protein
VEPSTNGGLRTIWNVVAVGRVARTFDVINVNRHAAPVRISSVRCDSLETNGWWRISWLLQNRWTEQLCIEDAWLPHGRFRGEGHVALATQLDPCGWHRLELNVWALEKPGTIVQNAFLILQVRGKQRGWRVFVRMRIEIPFAGRPRPIVELVTAQPL